MPREKEGYRDELEQLAAFFPGKRTLTVSDVARYTGKCWRWCKKTYGINKDGISITSFARARCS